MGVASCRKYSSCVFNLVVVLTSLQLTTGARTPSWTAPTETPSFGINGTSYKAKVQDTIVLPCEVKNRGNYVLVWKRGKSGVVLTAGATKVYPDERIHLVDGYNLEIRDIKTADAGDYVCQVVTIQPMEITHTLEILVPPEIKRDESRGSLEVNKGASIILECPAEGNPVPKITWSRKNNNLRNDMMNYEGRTLKIENVSRHDAGIYVCTADNKVGRAATQEYKVKVLYPPEIEVEKSWVHSGEGYEALLVCIVHAEPLAEVVWYKGTLRLEPNEGRRLEIRGSRHILVLTKVQASDFGNYSCVADNSFGKSRAHLELSGIANPASFLSFPKGLLRDSYNISWSVDSYTPIEEFKLFFRKIPKNGSSSQTQGPNSNKRPTRRQDYNSTTGSWNAYAYNRLHSGWNDITLPVQPSESFTKKMWYTIKNLEPAAQYEAQVQAKNRFGWNQISDKFSFSTRGESNSVYDSQSIYSEPEMRDMGVIFNSATCLYQSLIMSIVVIVLTSAT
ncbi:lachesin isoform X2 [Bemisia tabaci]|uniref:lachesin isoform X2 n=1 Tax=Bemisia tabaci TaxID=7038 RepID=UPI0008F9C36D|nr:PREDICTED: lachesin-like isoform X2 [Bemisia tabaci]